MYQCKKELFDHGYCKKNIYQSYPEKDLLFFFRDGISKFIILFPLTLVLLNKQFMNPLTYDKSKLIKFLKKKIDSVIDSNRYSFILSVLLTRRRSIFCCCNFKIILLIT